MSKSLRRTLRLGACALTAYAMLAQTAHAQPSFETLVTLNGASGTDPGGLIIDTAGNLFGVTSTSSTSNGTVFEISGHDHRTLTRLIDFTGGNSFSPGNLDINEDGNLYCTALNNLPPYSDVFKISGLRYSTLTTLTDFTFKNAGSGATSLMMLGAPPPPASGGGPRGPGNLFGVTIEGGHPDASPSPTSEGTAFELYGRNLTKGVTLAFFNAHTGINPATTLVPDAVGNLYGTTRAGGAYGVGMVFVLSGPDHRDLALLALSPAQAA